MSQPEQIKARRGSLALNQAQLAQALGLHPMTISKFERGLLVPNLWFWLALEELGRRLNRQRRKEAKQKERLKAASR